MPWSMAAAPWRVETPGGSFTSRAAGLAAEALDLRRRGAGLAQPETNRAHQGVAVPATKGDSDFRIEGYHRTRVHLYNVRDSKNVSPGLGRPPSEAIPSRVMTLLGHYWTI